jgi:hypothetical protein
MVISKRWVDKSSTTAGVANRRSVAKTTLALEMTEMTGD